MDQPARLGDEDNVRRPFWPISVASFTNNADGFACKGTPYPVSGTNQSIQITFTVNFLKCRSVATWQGDAAGFGMSVPWVLKYFDATGKPQTMTGFDFFGQ